MTDDNDDNEAREQKAAMTPEQAALQRKIDEASTQLADMLPKFWRGIYLGCIGEGFSLAEAFSLTKVYIISTGTNGTSIHKD